jgi:hypothetical protein
MTTGLILGVSRFLLLASAITVSAIVAFFTYRLHENSFKLPWTFAFVSYSTFRNILETEQSSFKERPY